MSDILTLNDAVVDSLNGAVFTPTFTAVKSYFPRTSRTGSVLRVFVMPVADEAIKLQSREKKQQHDYSIQVGIISPVAVVDGVVDVTEFESLVNLTEAIKDHVIGATDILSESGVSLFQVVHNPIWDQSILSETNEYRSAPVFQFRVIRS